MSVSEQPAADERPQVVGWLQWVSRGRARLEGWRRGTMVRPAYLWDYDFDEATFREILAGRLKRGSLDRDWAAVRLLEYAPYAEIVHLLGFRQIVEGWPKWRPRIRSESRRRGFDFLASWLPEHHPEVMVDPTAAAHG
jgi:hypothetical protein